MAPRGIISGAGVYCACAYVGGILDGATLRVSRLVTRSEYLPLVVVFIFTCCSNATFYILVCLYILRSVQQHVYTVVTPACKLPVFLVIAEKGVGHAIDGEEGRTVCRGIVQG